MRAALLQTIGEMAIIDTPDPVVDHAEQVIVQVKAVGICGSEVHAFHGTHPFRKAPSILGHEAAGVVTAVGRDVRSVKPGDRVIIDPQWVCGSCRYCRAGHINLCPQKKVLGTAAWPGAFAEYVLVPEETVLPLPHHLSFVQGSLVEPLTIGVHVARRANLKAGESVAVLGAGSIGGLVCGVCRASGASTVIASDIRQHALDVVRLRLGADPVILLPDDHLVEKVMDITNGAGVDVVFIAADDVTLVNRAIEMTTRRGRIVLIALLTEALVQFAAYQVISKELEIIGSTMANNDDVRRAIDLASSGAVDVAAIATHVLPLASAQQAMELAATKNDSAIKVVLTFQV